MPWAAAWSITTAAPWTRSWKALEKDDYRFSTLIIGVIKSEPFQMRTTRGDQP